MRIFVDYREHGDHGHNDSRADRAVISFEAQHCYYSDKDDIVVIELPVGDYLFESDDMSVVFEYKTLADYFNSLHDGSLFEEVANQTLKHDFSFVIIEGDYNEYVRSVWDYKKRYGLLDDKYLEGGSFSMYRDMSNQFEGSLRRLRAMSCPILVDDEVHAFREMYEQALKCFSQPNKIYAGSKRAFINGDVVSLVLSGCDGAGESIVSNIKEVYNPVSLVDLLGISVHDFEQVPLIGEKRANNIYDYIHQGEDKNG